MAFTLPIIRRLAGLAPRAALIMALCMTCVVVLAACGGDPDPTATTPPTAAPTATPEPTATPVPTPTPVPPTPVPATLEPTAMPVSPSAGEFSVELTPATRWQELFDAFTEPERECISSELGDDLMQTISSQRVMSESGGETSIPSIFRCLSKETASTLFLATFQGQAGGLNEEAEQCLRDLLLEIDVAGILAASMPGAKPSDMEAMQIFTIGIVTCAPELMMGEGPQDSMQSGGDMLWSHPTGGFVVNAPTVVDGVVYVGSDDNNVYALDASTGFELGSFRTGDVVRSSPTVVDGVVYVGSNDNHVYAVDTSTGSELWSHDTEDWVQYSPVVSKGVVYFKARADGDQKLHAVNAKSGDVLWVSPMPYPYIDRFALTVAGGKVYMPGEGGEFYALDASTGELSWSFSVSLGAESPATVVDGVVYLTAVTTAHALDEATGAEIWSYDTEMYPARDFTATVVDGVYYFSPNDILYALDAATGQPIWSYEASELINIRPLVADGMVYTSSEDGQFYALNAATGDLVWSREGTDSRLASPSVTDGVLYAESSDGNLRAINAATGEELWKFQKGYFDGVPSYTVSDGVLYVGALDGSVYAFPAPAGG